MDNGKKKQNLSKKKIINSAIVLFANKGFDATSTREICKHADVNLSLIPYYFGNKEGLYINIIESIIDYGLSFLQEEIKQAENVDSMAHVDKINLYRNLLTKYLDFLYSDNVPNSFVILMIKEQIVLHSKFSLIYSRKIDVFYQALHKTLASILGKKENDKKVIMEASFMIGQILTFKYMDSTILPYLNQDFYSKVDVQKLKKIILSHIDNSIKDLCAENLSVGV
jgi:TetR/AcrR family transcriptional regulator, regulator of cefoperazone and chloramphenicol sensitivity